MTNIDYNTLQCRIKALQGQVDSFKSGKEYQKLRAQHAKDVAYYHGEIGKLQKNWKPATRRLFGSEIYGLRFLMIFRKNTRKRRSWRSESFGTWNRGR